MDHFTVLTWIYLRDWLWEFFIVLILVLQLHEFLLKLTDLSLMKFYFITNLTDQMGIQSFQNIRHILHLFETAFFIVKFSDLFFNTDNLLFEFFLFCKIRLSELYKLIIFPCKLIRLIFKFWEIFIDFMFFHLEDFSR